MECKPSSDKGKGKRENWNKSFTEALKEKYCSDEAEPTYDFVIVGSRSPKRKKNLAAQEAELAHLRTVVLNDMSLTKAGIPPQGLASLCPNVVDLDLADNSLSHWSELLEILTHLPKVKFVNFSRNSLSIEPDYALPETKLPVENLALNNTGVALEETLRLSKIMPQLKELHLCGNKYKSLPDIKKGIKEGHFGALECLRLNNNSIDSWSEVWKLRHLPQLKNLILSGNPIKEIFYAEEEPMCEDADQSDESLVICDDGNSNNSILSDDGIFPQMTPEEDDDTDANVNEGENELQFCDSPISPGANDTSGNTFDDFCDDFDRPHSRFERHVESDSSDRDRDSPVGDFSMSGDEVDGLNSSGNGNTNFNNSGNLRDNSVVYEEAEALEDEFHKSVAEAFLMDIIDNLTVDNPTERSAPVENHAAEQGSLATQPENVAEQTTQTTQTEDLLDLCSSNDQVDQHIGDESSKSLSTQNNANTSVGSFNSDDQTSRGLSADSASGCDNSKTNKLHINVNETDEDSDNPNNGACDYTIDKFEMDFPQHHKAASSQAARQTYIATFVDNDTYDEGHQCQPESNLSDNLNSNNSNVYLPNRLVIHPSNTCSPRDIPPEHSKHDSVSSPTTSNNLTLSDSFSCALDVKHDDVSENTETTADTEHKSECTKRQSVAASSESSKVNNNNTDLDPKVVKSSESDPRPKVDPEPDLKPFERLESLCLSEAEVCHWSHLHALREFPSLRHVRMLANPLYASVHPDDRRKLYISSLPKVTHLNGSEVTIDEREKSERHFLRHFMNDEEKPDMYHTLVEKHGPPVKLVEIDLGGGFKKWVSLTFIVKYLPGPDSFQPKVMQFTKKVGMVGAAKKLGEIVQKEMGLPKRTVILYHNLCGPSQPEHNRGIEELRCDSMPMSRFDFADGDEIHIFQHVLSDAELSYMNAKRMRDQMLEFPSTTTSEETQPMANTTYKTHKPMGPKKPVTFTVNI